MGSGSCNYSSSIVLTNELEQEMSNVFRIDYSSPFSKLACPIFIFFNDGSIDDNGTLSAIGTKCIL